MCVAFFEFSGLSQASTSAALAPTNRLHPSAVDSVVESHGPCESFERPIVRIGLETTELRVDSEI